MSALELKKKILRHCLLSYALVMASVSPGFAKVYSGSDQFVKKGLADYEYDIRRMKKQSGSNVGWLDKWWIPINWSCILIQNESGSDGHCPKESKEVINRLVKFKAYLSEIVEYFHNPIPAIMSQAVHIVCWGFLILGAIAYQPAHSHLSGVWAVFDVSFLLGGR